MSSLWTPGGEHPVDPTSQDQQAGSSDVSAGAGTSSASVGSPQDALRAAAEAAGIDFDALSEEERQALQLELDEALQVHQEIAATPASEILANHMMQLFRLAAIYLQAQPPAFGEAATVIEAFRATLDGVGDRFDDHYDTLRDALAQLQFTYVQVKEAYEAEKPTE